MNQIKFVTFTGADDSVNPHDLVEIAKRYGDRIEFGILFSSSRQGTNRYPSIDWVKKLSDIVTGFPINFSAHLCGEYISDMGVVKSSKEHGRHLWIDQFVKEAHIFSRIQINSGHTPPEGFSESEYLRSIKRFGNRKIIVQSDGSKMGHHTLLSLYGIEVQCLIDSSGGTGKESIFIPPGYESEWGFAGGINPDNVSEKIMNIQDVYAKEFWIDMESGIRTNDKLDLDKIESVMEKMKFVCSK